MGLPDDSGAERTCVVVTAAKNGTVWPLLASVAAGTSECTTIAAKIPFCGRNSPLVTGGYSGTKRTGILKKISIPGKINGSDEASRPHSACLDLFFRPS
jgi:hypothetical protein